MKQKHHGRHRIMKKMIDVEEDPNAIEHFLCNRTFHRHRFEIWLRDHQNLRTPWQYMDKHFKLDRISVPNLLYILFPNKCVKFIWYLNSTVRANGAYVVYTIAPSRLKPRNLRIRYFYNTGVTSVHVVKGHLRSQFFVILAACVHQPLYFLIENETIFLGTNGDSHGFHGSND